MSRGLTEKPALTATNGLAYLACIMRTDCERAGDRSCLCKEGASCLCEVNRSHLCDEPRFLLNCQAFINNPVPGSLPSAERMTVSVWARDRICTSSPLYYFKGLKWGGGVSIASRPVLLILTCLVITGALNGLRFPGSCWCGVRSQRAQRSGMDGKPCRPGARES